MKHRRLHFFWTILLALFFVGSVLGRHTITPWLTSIATGDLILLGHGWLDWMFPLIIGLIALKSFFYGSRNHRWFLPFWVSIGMSIFLALFLQEVLFSDTSQIVLDYFFPLRRNVTFPSLHTALASAMILPYLRIHKPTGWLLALLTLLTGGLELISLDHVLSDVLGGALLGYLTSLFVVHLEEDFHGISKVSRILHQDLEMRRQIAHALMGLGIITFIYLGLVNGLSLLVITLLGGIVSILCKYYRLPLITPLLHFFEREEHMKRFPGRGPFFFVAGSCLACILFPRDIALASIMILGLGDSFTNLLGRTFGKTHFFYNPCKTIEGPLYATVIAGIGASFFAPILFSFTAALGGLFFESLPLRIGKIEVDDNLTIPVVAGAILWGLTLIVG